MPSDDQKPETTPNDSGVNPTTSNSLSSQTQSQKTSGETDSSPKPWSEERLDEVTKIQQAMRTRTSMRGIVVDDMVQHYLDLPHSEIRKLPHWECAEASLLIHRAAFHVQSEINQFQTKEKWAEDCITSLVSKKITRYGTQFTPYEYRRAMAIRDNEAAMSLEVIRVKLRVAIDEMAYMPKQLTSVANAYGSLAEAKRYTRNETS